MNEPSTSGDSIFGCALLAIPIISSIASGYIAYEWIKPDTFPLAILFVVAWSLVGSIMYYLLATIGSLFIPK